ncbi:MAG: hypothetical protein ACREL1_09510 [bacterium]
MWTNHLYFFRHARTGSLYQALSPDSDRALLKCLHETKWKMDVILYEGKEILTTPVEHYFPET